jgi:hypothetical protein
MILLWGHPEPEVKNISSPFGETARQCSFEFFFETIPGANNSGVLPGGF